MTRQIYSARTVEQQANTEARSRPNPSMQQHSQFVPSDWAVQILLQQFL